MKLSELSHHLATNFDEVRAKAWDYAVETGEGDEWSVMLSASVHDHFTTVNLPVTLFADHAEWAKEVERSFSGMAVDFIGFALPCAFITEDEQQLPRILCVGVGRFVTPLAQTLVIDAESMQPEGWEEIPIGPLISIIAPLVRQVAHHD